MRHSRLILTSLSVAAMLACDSMEPRDDRVGDAAAAADGAAGNVEAGARAPAAGDTIVAQPVHWDTWALERTLRAAGLDPVRAGTSRSNAFPNILAAEYDVGSAQVRAFFFGDPVAAARAVQRLQPRRDRAATAFTTNNLVIVVRAERETVRERIRRALTLPEAQGAVDR